MPIEVQRPAGDLEWNYVSVRRIAAFLEHSIDRGLQWAVFEPNAEPLWTRIRDTVGDLLAAMHRLDAFAGERPEEACFVRCDASTLTEDDLDRGRAVVLVGFAPLRPAEFVILRFYQKTLEAAA